jgi:hypothetical protein
MTVEIVSAKCQRCDDYRTHRDTCTATAFFHYDWPINILLIQTRVVDARIDRTIRWIVITIEV